MLSSVLLQVVQLRSCLKIKMKFLLIVTILFVALARQCYCAAIDNCHMEKLTVCGDPLVEFRKKMGTSFPTEVDQVNELCKKMDEAYDCAEKFRNKCMTPMQIQTLSFLSEGSIQAYDEFCTEGSQTRTDYLKHAKCIDESSKTEEAKANYEYIEAALESFAEKEPKDRLPTACCGYALLTEKSHQVGEKNCGKEAVVAFQKVVDMAASTLPNVVCSGFLPESDICKSVLPPPGTKPKGTLKNSHIAQTFASMYLQDLQ